jgi:hypothetical protein
MDIYHDDDGTKLEVYSGGVSKAKIEQCHCLSLQNLVNRMWCKTCDGDGSLDFRTFGPSSSCCFPSEPLEGGEGGLAGAAVIW